MDNRYYEAAQVINRQGPFEHLLHGLGQNAIEIAICVVILGLSWWVTGAIMLKRAEKLKLTAAKDLQAKPAATETESVSLAEVLHTPAKAAEKEAKKEAKKAKRKLLKESTQTTETVVQANAAESPLLAKEFDWSIYDKPAIERKKLQAF